MTHVVFEELDRVALVRFHRPEVLNALGPQTFLELEKIWETLESHPKIRAVILTGEGDKAFVSGADIAALSHMGKREVTSYLTIAHRVLDKIEASPLLSIACLHGYALGGGLELALACDFIFAGDKAQLGFPEVHLALVPGFGAFKRLPPRVGKSVAKQLLLRGNRISAEEGEKIGLVDKLFHLDSLLPSTLLFLDEVLKAPPKVIHTIKRGLQYPDEADHLFSASFESEDAKKRIDDFLSKKGKKVHAHAG